MEAVTSGAPDQPPRRRRLGVALGVAIVVLIAPAIALANHQFGDVPTSASYHDEVSSLVGAGITSGCGGGNYCPNQAVTRGQMAQFMTRGLGIATAGYGELAASEADNFYVATVPIHTGGLPGKTGFVTVDADLQVLDTNAFCPCGVIFSIEETTTLEPGPTGTMVVSDVVAGGAANSGSISWVFEVPTGSDVEYGLWASVFTDPALSGVAPTGIDTSPVLTGSLTAEYSPFGTAGELPAAAASLDLQGWGGKVSIERGRSVQGR
jgi:hypothetical protein